MPGSKNYLSFSIIPQQISGINLSMTGNTLIVTISSWNLIPLSGIQPNGPGASCLSNFDASPETRFDLIAI